jgi:hypothetical protein
VTTSIINWAESSDLVDGITYENIELAIGTRSKWPHRIDLRPNDIEPMIERPHNAFEAVKIANLKLKNYRSIGINQEPAMDNPFTNSIAQTSSKV